MIIDENSTTPVVQPHSTSSIPPPSIMDVISKAVSDCLEEEFDLLVEDAVAAEVRKEKPKDNNKQRVSDEDVYDRDREKDISSDNRQIVKESDQVSLLQSVGTTVNHNRSILTDNETVNDDRTDFLAERESCAMIRVPSKIVFKPRGRSYVVQVGEYDVVPVREGSPNEVMDFPPPTVPQNNRTSSQIPRSSSLVQSASWVRSSAMTRAPSNLKKPSSSMASIPTLPRTGLSMLRRRVVDEDPAEVVVQGRDGVEILSTKRMDVKGQNNSSNSGMKKSGRWMRLGRLSRRGAH